MSDEFEWQTDVDGDWDQPGDGPPRSQRQVSRRTKLIVMILGAILLLATALWIYQTLTSRVEEATATAESGLLMTYQLLADGAITGDRDLVDSLVADRPATWHFLNSDLVARQLFFSRRPLGIEVVRDVSGPETTVDIGELTAELTGAEVVERRPYYVLAGEGVSRTVILERVFYFEQQNDRWQLASLADERAFWGTWITDERANVTVTYPQRDEAIAVKLARYLDSFLPALCANESMACPDGFHLTLKLDTDPASIRRLGDGLHALRSGEAAAANRVLLPAPTLVGRPVDDAGYAVLEEGYAGWVGGSVVAAFGQPESDSQLILAQFGLRTPAEPVRALPEPSLSTFPDGLDGPGQDVLLMCNDGRSPRLLRFATQTGTWQDETSNGPWRQTSDQSPWPSWYMSRLPSYDGVILQTSSGDGEDGAWRTYLWRDDAFRLLTEEPSAHYYLPPRLQAANQPDNGLLAFLVPADERGLQYTAKLLDLSGCDASPCELASLPGMPIWSPTGQKTLLIVFEADGGRMIKLGDAHGANEVPVGTGQSAVWVDKTRFVYIVAEQASPTDPMGRTFGQEVILVTLDEVTASVLRQEPYFDAEIVRQSMPESLRPDALVLWSVQPALLGDTWWFVSANGVRGDESLDYVLLFSPETRETRLALPLDDFRQLEPLLINEGGTKAVAMGLSADGTRLNVELIDASTGEVSSLPDLAPQDWSAHGDWLVQSDRGTLYLVSAIDGRQWPVRHDVSGCYSAVWVEQMGD